jgi:Putative beta barrel porin-7 (BBP7)
MGAVRPRKRGHAMREPGSGCGARPAARPDRSHLLFGIAVAAAIAAAGWPASAPARTASRQCFVDAATHKPVAAPKSAADARQLIGVPCRSAVRPAGRTAGPPRLFALAEAPPLLTKDVPPVPPAWWVTAEGLVWWTKSAPLPPTLTTFTPGSPSATTGAGGALGVPGTIVFSPSNLNYDPSAGARFTIGRWLDPAHAWAVEAEGSSWATRAPASPVLPAERRHCGCPSTMFRPARVFRSAVPRSCWRRRALRPAVRRSVLRCNCGARRETYFITSASADRSMSPFWAASAISTCAKA